MAEPLADDGSDFAALLGSFGTHANKAKRAKAERLAVLKRTDGRRNREVTRPHQFNVRVDTETLELSKALIEKFASRDGQKWSQADLIMHAIAALAEAEKLTGGGQ